MDLTAVEQLVIVGAVASSMTAADLLKRLMKGKEAEDPRLGTRSAEIGRKLSDQGIYLGLIITVVAWGLAAILHARHSDPLRTVTSSTVKIVIVTVVFILGTIAQAILLHAKGKFVRKKKSEKESLTAKDLSALKALRKLQWMILFLVVLCIGATFLTRF